MRNVSPARTRSGQSSPASSPGQFSDQSEDEEEEHHAEKEAFDPCGIPPVEARSALDHKLLGTSPDDPTDPVDVPVVSTPPQTASTSTTPVASVYSRLGPPRDGSSDHTVPPHPDLTRSWRESWEAQDFKLSRPLAHLSIYLQRTQGFISATILNWEKERAALLAGLPPPPMPQCMVDKTLAGAVSLANYLTAAIATRQKLEAGFDPQIRFLSAALAESNEWCQ